jgi:hypothetical protein
MILYLASAPNQGHGILNTNAVPRAHRRLRLSMRVRNPFLTAYPGFRLSCAAYVPERRGGV